LPIRTRSLGGHSSHAGTEIIGASASDCSGGDPVIGPLGSLTSVPFSVIPITITVIMLSPTFISILILFYLLLLVQFGFVYDLFHGVGLQTLPGRRLD
jgi:hypothetical protein